MGVRAPALCLLACFALVPVACGDDDKSSSGKEESEATASPQKAVAEIATVKELLAEAVKQVEDGDRAAAEETVSEAYVEHFEIVEGPLEKVDEELNEELEEKIREQLRDEIKNDAPATEVKKLVGEIDGELDTAAKKLE